MISITILTMFYLTTTTTTISAAETTRGNRILTMEFEDNSVLLNETISSFVPSAVPSETSSPSPTTTTIFSMIPSQSPITSSTSTSPSAATTSTPTNIPTLSPPTPPTSHHHHHSHPSHSPTISPTRRYIPKEPIPTTPTTPTSPSKDDERTTPETMNEMKKDRNVQKLSIFILLLGITGMLFTAQQISENPNGLFASICRLTLRFVLCIYRIVCLPCRFLMFQGSTTSSTSTATNAMGHHQHVMSVDNHRPLPDEFENDLELT